MEGKELYDSLVSKRDYSGNTADEYAQFLSTLFLHIGTELFPLLETASKEFKVLSLKTEISNSDILIDEYSIEDIILI
ncbi:hypothetical protein [Flavobacterium sp. UMI-01]|uniref:hypothetical protein n=1 Tax=Flavobacterium sp. UMI-01 TaxID=1441053 RepID=UPI001C7CEA0E|nr:hypothetical protein [Flavobacterium sp. UMI-01]GIZ10271.1 hypothetical protein FUMI01_29950 [Flavobacterium sp. UMI-01]